MTSIESTALTLARLSFWIPVERKDEFGAVYEVQMAPLLARHGLVAQPDIQSDIASSPYKRVAPWVVYSRFFVVASPAVVADYDEELEHDPQWQMLIQRLGTAFALEGSSGKLAYKWGHYQTSAGPGQKVEVGSGKTVKAGPGKSVAVGSGWRQGAWQSWSVSDGMPTDITAWLQDRHGDLWFATCDFGAGLGTDLGLWRFDGALLYCFTQEDGLPHDGVTCLLEDRDGALWIGTKAGLCRYDGETFLSYTTADGLAANEVAAILQDQYGHLWIGTTGGVSRYDGEAFVTFTTADGLAHNKVACMLEDSAGRLWFGAGWNAGSMVGLSCFEEGCFRVFTSAEGLLSDWILSLLEDRDGRLWIGTNQGVCSFDGRTFSTAFTTSDVQTLGGVMAMLQDRAGNLWFAIWGEGLKRYDGEAYVTFTVQDGLTDNRVASLLEDGHGQLWVGTQGSGGSRYDGQRMTTFTTREGLGHNSVLCLKESRQGRLWAGCWSGISYFNGEDFTALEEDVEGEVQMAVLEILEDPQGHLWFFGNPFYDLWVGYYDDQRLKSFPRGRGLPHPVDRGLLEDREGRLWFTTRDGGLCHYDGEEWTAFDKIGQRDKWVCMYQDRKGQLWFGDTNGVSCYDGEKLEHFTPESGLPPSNISAILEDREGNMWFGGTGGVSRYDGQTMQTFTTEDGLDDHRIRCILEDRSGQLWFGSAGGGGYRYDGRIFQYLSRRDGLPHDGISQMIQDRHGDIWIGTAAGLTRYRSSSIPPRVELQAVITDRLFQPIGEIHIPVSQERVAFEFQGCSLITLPERMVYVYRLQGFDADWQPAYRGRVEYENLSLGTYTFQVKAVDQDLNYSEPVQVELRIVPDPRDERIGELEARVRERTRELEETHRHLQAAQQQLIDELEEELQTAHDMQMGLMPTQSPQIEGFDIAGRCLPFNHVGGDFFQYFLQNGRLCLCMADVTGHAMKAAIPVVMFSGILKSEMRRNCILEQLYQDLNRTLCETLDKHTFICFVLGEIDLSTRQMRLSNGGCPSPYHFHACTGQLEELEIGAYPLGIQSNIQYPVTETRLESGNYVIFCSDGIAETANAEKQMYGFERTAETIRQACAEDLPAEVLIDRLLAEIQAFTGEEPQGDDRTVVVLRVE